MVLSELDRDLLRRCLARTDGAWEAFVDRYLGLLTHVAVSTASLRLASVSDDVRDDMVAEILLALVDDDFAILRRFKGQSSLGTYLVVVARRIAARRALKLSTSPLHSANGAHLPALESKDASSAEGLMDAEEVKSLISHLDSNEATAIRLYHLEHRSYRDIGERMGIPENSVGPLLSRAREHMRKQSS